MLFAWLSLFSVGFADFYVWMVASGRISDLRSFLRAPIRILPRSIFSMDAIY